ncbi:TPD1 protein homolog 1B-like [Miscanthus floridulus]|uniref:TPD1 protein homolog 1B-like n=1 Tax=Miscanthus floridulus TaxID=154761 RepID=UPI00345AA8B6
MGQWCFKKRAALVIVVISSLLLLLITAQAAASGHHPSSWSTLHQARKLLNTSTPPSSSSPPSPPGVGDVSTARMGPDGCSGEDVVVYQSSANPLPSGIPAYTVQIINVCSGGCTVYDVHVSCGDFASTELVDPAKFQRVSFNDCVVKGGGTLEPSETVSFQYSNSFSYQLSVASVACH